MQGEHADGDRDQEARHPRDQPQAGFDLADLEPQLGQLALIVRDLVRGRPRYVVGRIARP